MLLVILCPGASLRPRGCTGFPLVCPHAGWVPILTACPHTVCKSPSLALYPWAGRVPILAVCPCTTWVPSLAACAHTVGRLHPGCTFLHHP